MTQFDKKVLEDEKIQTVMAMLKEGYSKEEIYNHYGVANWKSIDMYFRRKGFRWKNNNFIPINEAEEQERKERLETVTIELTKPAKIIRLLEKESANIYDIATKNGFETIEELGIYMNNKGYKWDSESENYKEYYEEKKIESVDQKQENDFIKRGYDKLLQYLLENEDRLKEVIETDNKALPNYSMRGCNANKTLTMNQRIIALLVDYSGEHNLTQKTIVETALIEFFEKYGYRDEVKRVFSP